MGARNYGVEVYGIDLSTNMIGIAQEYRSTMEPEVQHRCQFYVDDATTMKYPENFYDVVYSRDTILHIDDKLSLYKKLLSCLKPGGKLMITDYNDGDKDGRAGEVCQNQGEVHRPVLRGGLRLHPRRMGREDGQSQRRRPGLGILYGNQMKNECVKILKNNLYGAKKCQ